MDESKTIVRHPDGQGATRKYYKKKDGSLALAIEPNVIEFGKVIPVRDRSILGAYEDALGRARGALRAGIEADDIDDALVAFEANADAALAHLREALKS